MQTLAPSVFVVSDCPASPGFGYVIILKSLPVGSLFFFAPCCGLGWKERPSSCRLDETNSLDEVAPGGVALPTRIEIKAGGYNKFVTREIPYEEWADDIPLSKQT
jgi:hypothetical protein